MHYTPTLFRERASECFGLAEDAESEVLRQNWRRCAAAYERLADMADYLEREDLVGSGIPAATNLVKGLR